MPSGPVCAWNLWNHFHLYWITAQLAWAYDLVGQHSLAKEGHLWPQQTGDLLFHGHVSTKDLQYSSCYFLNGIVCCTVAGSFFRGMWLLLQLMGSSSENWLRYRNWVRNHDFLLEEPSSVSCLSICNFSRLYKLNSTLIDCPSLLPVGMPSLYLSEGWAFLTASPNLPLIVIITHTLHHHLVFIT